MKKNEVLGIFPSTKPKISVLFSSSGIHTTGVSPPTFQAKFISTCNDTSATKPSGAESNLRKPKLKFLGGAPPGAVCFT